MVIIAVVIYILFYFIFYRHKSVNDRWWLNGLYFFYFIFVYDDDFFG